MFSAIAAAEGKVWVVGEDAEVLGVGLGLVLGDAVGLALVVAVSAGLDGGEVGGTNVPGEGLATGPEGLVISTPTPIAAPTSTTIPTMIKISRRREPNGPDPEPPRPGG
jgi:hypothetical protein